MDDIQLYLIVKIVHIISIISWMVGLLYLPRLFVYHSLNQHIPEINELLKVMEKRLARFIMLPSMILSYIFGLWLAYLLDIFREPWFHIKFSFVLILSAIHGIMVKHMKNFANDRNSKSHKFYRILNEIPTILMIIIISVVIFK